MLTLLHPEFATQSPLVSAFMDKCEVIEDDDDKQEQQQQQQQVRIVGWALSRMSGGTARPVRFTASMVQEPPLHLDPVLRRDVAEVHGGAEALNWCGWDQVIPAGSGRLEMLFPSGTWVPFMEIAAAADDNGGGKQQQQQEQQEEATLVGALRSAAPLPSFVVVDDVYADPHAVRAFALQQEFHAHPAYHRGERTETTFLFPGLKELFERALAQRICEKDWHTMGTNGCFQWCRAGDQIVYHADAQQWAGVIFLTPDAPPECGTSLYQSRGPSRARRPAPGVFDGGFLDATKFERVDAVGNVFNRLVLFDAQLIHAASQYFGTDAASGRLFQMFFFNLEG